MQHVIVRTDFGEIRFEYGDETELAEILKRLPNDIALISETALSAVKMDLGSVKPGYEKVYRFSPRGSVELLVIPESGVVAAALTLFAAYPETLHIEEIKRSTGNQDVERAVLSQTNNKKYFVKTEDFYGLSDEGRKWIMAKIPPQTPQGDEPVEK